MNVGLLGVGIMGWAMSANLLKAGFDVIGYDGPETCLEKGRALAGIGCRGASSAREVAEQAEVVISVLPNTAALELDIHGPDGLLASGRKGLILIESSTFPLEDKIKAAEALTAAGMHMLDCPLSGTGAQAVSKDLAVYGSGPREIYDRCRDVFSGFARSAHYLGELGNGTKMKFVANLLVAIHNVSAAEAFVLGMKSGLDPDLIYRVISDGAGASRMFDVRGPMMVEGRYDQATMKVDIWQKDMKIIGEHARSIGCPTPLFGASAQVYTAAEAQGRGSEDTASVCAVLEEWARLLRKKEQD